MNANQLNGMRKMAEAMGVKHESYKLLDGNGRVVMFDITKERAEEYARYYKGAKVVRM